MARPFLGRKSWILLGLTTAGFALGPVSYAAAQEAAVSSVASPQGASTSAERIRVRVKPSADPSATSGIAFRTTLNSKPTQTFIKVLEPQGGVYVPLAEILRLFDFPIELDAGQVTARGFFIKPEKTFRLDEQKRTVQIGTKTLPLSNEDVRRQNGQLYISEKALLSWFGILSTIDIERLALHYSTTEILPAEAREARKKKRQNLLSQPVSLVAAGKASVEKKSFQGITQPHYEVELYRNETLVAFQMADETGRYAFDGIPALTGDAVFRLAFYGPQGQFEERVETQAVAPPVVAEPTPAKPVALMPAAPPPVAVQPVDEKKKEGIKDTPKAMATTTGHESMPIQAKNWIQLSVVRSSQTLGDIESYIGVRGTFLRLDAFLRFMGISYNQQTTSDGLDIVVDPIRTIKLDLTQRAYTDQGQKHALYDNDLFKNDDKIYANTDLLYRLFPRASFLVDQTNRKLSLPEIKKEEVAVEKTAADTAPVPSAAPVQPVIIDDPSTGQQRQSGPTSSVTDEPEAQDVLHFDRTSETKEQTKEQGKEPEDKKNAEPLILQPQLKNLPPSNAFIEALDYAGQIFVPLNDMVQIIGFPIKFGEGMKEASGFFFTSDNEFYLNFDKREARAGEKRINLTEHDVMWREGQIYVSTESFGEWFGFTCQVDKEQAILHLKTDRLLPEEEKNARQKQWNRLLGAVEPSDDDLPVLKNDYRAIGYPTVDVVLGSSYMKGRGSTATKAAGDYTLQGSMEAGYLTNEFFVQGASDGSAFNTMRLQSGRKDPAARLLGGMNATEFALGDITSPAASFATASSLGRGAMVTNRSVTSAENFDVRSFSGDAVPGYEVELYRNNLLVSFQTVDANGRYNFTDIPILYGENIFRIVLYGPQGQREEKIETVSASSALLKAGQFEYTLGAMQRGLSLLPFTENTASTANTPNGAQLVAGARYGVTQGYTIGAGAAETRLADGPHRYFTASSGANLFGTLSETIYARDMTTGGWASGVSVLTGFEDVSLRARYRTYSNFISESINNNDLPLKSDAQLDANTQMVLPLLNDFSVGLSGRREEFVNDLFVPRYTYGFSVAKSLWGLSLSNKVDYIHDSEQRIQDTFGIQTRLWNISFRTAGIYDVKPDPQFRSASIMADYRLADRLSGQTQIDKDLITKKTALNQAINWDFDTFRLSLNNNVDDEGDYAVGLNILFSLNHNEITNKWQSQPQQTSSGGAIAGRAFVDANNNGVFDEGEKYLPDASVRVNRAAVNLDENGYFVTPITPYETAKVELDGGRIDDPLLTPKTRGYRVETRPGDTVIADFPMVQTTLIDGVSYFLDNEGTRRELGGIVIELQDKDHKPIRRVISEVDGYYTFDKIQAGEYWISVPDEVLTAYNATLSTQR